MTLSDHTVTFLLASVIATLILGFHSTVNIQDELREESLSLRAEQLQEDILLVSNFSDGYVKTGLGGSYEFQPTDRGFNLSYEQRTVAKDSPVNIQGQSFTSKEFCLSRVPGGAKVTGGGSGDC
ncbi:MAG: hypothetical protein ABEJ07_01915 [Candidatus Nanohaloarchaea archaeon]